MHGIVMNKLEKNLIRMHKAVVQRAFEMFDCADTVSIHYESSCFISEYGVSFVHIHMLNCDLATFRIKKPTTSIKKVLQQMTHDNVSWSLSNGANEQGVAHPFTAEMPL
jgi:hypothetical protein